MSAAQNSFRGSVFGGFNRQDVLTYLERSAREHSQQVESLQKKLSQLSLDQNDKTTQLAGLSEKDAQLSSENQRLAEALESARAELEEKRGRLSAAEEDLSVLRDRAAELEANAEAYIRLRDRTATIELDARNRAQIILNDAHTQADSIRAQVEDWLDRAETRYEHLRADIGATLSHAIGELARVQRALEQSSASFAEHDEALESLVRWCESDPVPAGALCGLEAKETGE